MSSAIMRLPIGDVVHLCNLALNKLSLSDLGEVSHNGAEPGAGDMAWKSYLPEARAAIPIIYGQAIEDAAKVAHDHLHPTNPEDDWTPYASDKARHARTTATAIRALAPVEKGASSTSATQR